MEFVGLFGLIYSCVSCFHYRSECSTAVISLVDSGRDMEQRIKIIDVRYTSVCPRTEVYYNVNDK
jgi:hypothetical protein